MSQKKLTSKAKEDPNWNTYFNMISNDQWLASHKGRWVTISEGKIVAEADTENGLLDVLSALNLNDGVLVRQVRSDNKSKYIDTPFLEDEGNRIAATTERIPSIQTIMLSMLYGFMVAIAALFIVPPLFWAYVTAYCIGLNWDLAIIKPNCNISKNAIICVTSASMLGMASSIFLYMSL